MSILVTGAHGMVGRHLVAELKARGEEVLTPNRAEVDWTDQAGTRAYFKKHRPAQVYHLAAKVGGIAYNIAEPVQFLKENAEISTNVLGAIHENGVDKTLVLGSSCIYPRAWPQPMQERELLNGPLEPTNEGYALAKILALKLAEYYHKQFGAKFVCPIPSNIYGPGDTFDLQKSHVLSALIRRLSEAKDSITLWGTGKARREFVHVKDVVDGMIFMMEKVTTPEPVNLGPGDDVSISELATLVAKEVGYQGKIEWDHSRPDGMPRKCMDVSKMKALGFETKISLRDGIRETHRYFKESQK